MKRFLPYLITVAAGFCTFACMGDLHEYSECVQVETARCEFRDRCDASFDVQSCVAYYKEFCRTREIETDFEPAQIDACIADMDALGSAQQCARLEELGGKSEICVFSELASCREFLCLSDENDGDDDVDTADTETDAGGLNP